MFMKGSSSMLIAPCYDGRMLPGVQQVAGDGLSLISIKQSHRNCKFKNDPESNQPFISCAEGIKARNSFRNLLKPDLRKVRGLECSTTESMVQLFKAHNIENAGKLTYKKRVLRLLTSLVSKKSKSHSKPEVLLQSGSWPVNMCVLSSVCQEQEMRQPSTLNLENFSSVLDVLDDEKAFRKSMELKSFCVTEQTNMCNKIDIPSPVETVFISMPDPLTNSSDNAFIDVHKKIDSSNGGDGSSQENLAYGPLKQDKQMCEAAAPNQTVSSSFELEPKKSLRHISLSSHQNCCTKNDFADGIDEIQVHPDHIVNEKERNTTNNHESTTVIDNIKREVEEKLENFENDSSMNNYFTDDATVPSVQEFPKNSSSEVVQSIFTEMFKEMQEIEDYISSYISSFCMREEEFENYPALTRTSSEVVSHFFEQVHSPTMFEIDQNENGNTCVINNSDYEQKPKKEEEYLMDKNSVMTENRDKKECNTFNEEEISEYKYVNKNTSTLAETKSYKTNDNSIDDPNNLVERKNCLQDSISGYCYWEDSDLIDNGELLAPKSSTGSNTTLIENNKTLIAMSFFDNVYKEFYTGVDILSPFNDIAEERESLNSDRNQWARMYDENILKEAENIADCIDNFLVSGCFPNNRRSTNNNSCIITEIDDDFEQQFLKNNSNYRVNQFEDPGLTNKCQEAARSTVAQMFGYPEKSNEHASNESLYHENQLTDDEDAEISYERRQSYFLGNSMFNLQQTMADRNDSEEPKLIIYEIPTFSETHQFSINESLNQLKESIPTISNEIANSPNNEQNLIREELMSSTNELKVDEESSGIIVNSSVSKDIDTTCIDNSTSKRSEKEQSKTSLDQPSKNSNICAIKDSQNIQTPEYTNEFSNNQDYLNDKELAQKEEKVRDIDEQRYFAEEIPKSKITEVLSNQVFSSCDSIKDKFEQNTQEQKYSIPNLYKEDSKTSRSRFEQTPEATVSDNSQFVFTSPNVQLNLTNPMLDVNKK